MSQEPYVKLMERMNQNEVKHPQTQAMLNLLKELFTEEQAALVGDFPLGAQTPKSLAEKLGRDEDELDKMLKQMSKDGLIFETEAENGEPEYSVLPFEPGLIELQYLKGLDDERTRKFVKLINQVHVEEGAIMKALIEKPEAAKEAFSGPSLGRTLPIEEQIKGDKEVASWEIMTEIIENETSYAVGECGCKHIAKLNGEPCQSEAPSKCCVWFGKVADYMVERDYAVRHTKEELYALLEKCEEAGLVHMISNRNRSNHVVMCNCCKCCCHYLRVNRLLREIDIHTFEASNYVSHVDEETCTGCGECVDHCQAEALELDGDLLRINEDYCLGCGACVSICPTESLSLVRVSNKTLTEMPVKLAGSGVYV
jgi:Pyruvate/2-oxoacid:ferredoxin oxidoreductase delta subunit